MKMMRLPQPSYCCCFFSLNVGSFIIGWLCVVLSSVVIVCAVKELATSSQLHSSLREILSTNCDEKCLGSFYRTAVFVLTFVLLMSVVLVIIGFLLIVGVNKQRVRLMSPFLVCITALLLLLIVCWGVAVAFLFTVPLISGALSAILGLVVALCLHFALVVRAFQKEIIWEKRHRFLEGQRQFSAEVAV